MKIVADENIPLVDHYFGSYGDIVLKPGRAIQHDDLLDADILLVRSVTPVNEALLKNTPVKFVGSATTGMDHIDTVWLNKAGIPWSVSEGCNSAAVIDYVIACIAALQKMNVLPVANVRAAVIGVGRIGSEVANKLTALGFSVLLCDPYRFAKDKQFPHVFLENLHYLDFITIHTPLTTEGTYPTYHLIEKHFLERQKKNCILLNTSRGDVINFSDLKSSAKHLTWCLDVWENEPNIDLDILNSALIATPHIAGYSVQSKYRGIRMIYEAALQKGILPDQQITPMPYPRQNLIFHEQPADWRDVVLKNYNPLFTTQYMKQKLLQDSACFDELRKNFPERHELNYTDIKNAVLTEESEKILKQFKTMTD